MAYEMRISDWSSDVVSSDLLLQKLKNILPCCLISEEGEKAMNELKVSLREPDGIRQTWLTDEELDLRAGLYNQDGQFQRDIQRLWAECSDIILRISEESWRWE